MANDSSNFEYFRYNPSLPAAVIFVVLFLLTSVFHIFQLIRTRTWYFTPLVVGCLMECLGYIGRIWCSRQSPNWTLGAYIFQSLFLLVAPALFAASIYMILRRIIVAVDGERHSLIKEKWLTKIFVASDIASFLILSSGAGILASNNTSTSSSNTGQDIILLGLFIQIIGFGIFVIVALAFHRRILAHPTHQSMQPDMPWAKYLYVLYIASLLIMIRSVVRVVEYIQGNDGYVLSHEVFLYVFDGTLMLLAVGVFNIFHPSELLPGSKGAQNRQISLHGLGEEQ